MLRHGDKYNNNIYKTGGWLKRFKARLGHVKYKHHYRRAIKRRDRWSGHKNVRNMLKDQIKNHITNMKKEELTEMYFDDRRDLIEGINLYFNFLNPLKDKKDIDILKEVLKDTIKSINESNLEDLIFSYHLLCTLD